MLRALARLLTSILVVLLLAAIVLGVGAWLGPQRVTRKLVDAAEARDATLVMTPLQLDQTGSLRSVEISVRRGERTLTCSNVRLQPHWRSVLQTPRLASLIAERCELVLARAAPEAPASGGEDPSLSASQESDPVRAAQEALRALEVYTDVAEVGAFVVRREGAAEPTFRAEAIRIAGDSFDARVSGTVRGWTATGTIEGDPETWRFIPSELRPPEIPLCGRLCPAVSVGEVVVASGPRVRLSAVSVSVGGATLDADELLLDGHTLGPPTTNGQTPDAAAQLEADGCHASALYPPLYVRGLRVRIPLGVVRGLWSSLPLPRIGDEVVAPNEGTRNADEDPPWVLGPHQTMRRALHTLAEVVNRRPGFCLPSVVVQDARLSLGLLFEFPLPDAAFGPSIGWAPESSRLWQLAVSVEEATLRSPADQSPAFVVRIREGELTADATLTGTTVDHPGISASAFVIPDCELALRWRADAPTNVDVSGNWSSLRFNGLLQVSESTLAVQVEATEAWDCQAAWRSVPTQMLAQLEHDDVLLTGSFSPSVSLTVPTSELDRLSFDVSGLPGDCVPTHIDAAWDPAQLNSPDYQMTPSAEVMPTPRALGPGTADYVPLELLPSYLPALMYLSEEMNFPNNEGFSEGLVTRGLRLNLREGRYVYGGSTISQQLVKNLFLRREKSVGRKIEEAMLTWLMERTVPKWRILELYVNMIEFGPDVWGISQASWHYFGRPADALTPLEGAFLANLKPSPRVGNVYRRRGHSPLTGWWPERVQVLLERLAENGAFLSAKQVTGFSPYIVALRRDDAPIGDDGPVLGTEDGTITRIPFVQTNTNAPWWSMTNREAGD